MDLDMDALSLDTVDKPLTPHEVLQIPFIEKFWHQHGLFPSNAKLRERGVTEPHLLYKKPAFIKAMANRGIDPNSTETNPPVDPSFSKEQMAAILVMSDYLDKRSSHAKLKNLGITTTQWNAWMKQPKFKEYFHNIVSSNFDNAIASIQTGLAKKAEEGDVNAIKYYYEVTGRHNSDSGNVQNVKLVITRLVEVLQRKIKDPELLAEIGYEFQLVLDGGTSTPQIPAEHVLPGTNGKL